jgi:carbon starvation protein
MHPVDLVWLTKAIGEQTLVGRAGGAVSLAVGVAHMFSSIRGLSGLMKYCYHFLIMFEALFILTTVDAGTRIARFILQELLGKIYAPFKNTRWAPGSIFTSLVVVLAWGFLIWNASINTIWPMFGIANQLLASISLAIGTMMLVKMGKGRFAWTTAVPWVFVAVTSLTAAYQMIANHYWPKTATPFMVNFNIALIVLMVACSFIIFTSVVRKIFALRRPAASP